jgi:hypothetical protein
VRCSTRRALVLSSILAGLVLLGPNITSSADTPTASREVAATTSPAPAGVCLSGAQLGRLTTRRLARLAIVDPVDEGDVGALSSEVQSGVGGIILLGSDATPALSGELHQLLSLAPVGRVPLVMVDEEGGASYLPSATFPRLARWVRR